MLARSEPTAAERRTLVEAVEDGWWYATPLPRGRALAALFCDAATFRARGYATPAQWHAALRRTAHVFPYVHRPRAPSAVERSAVTPHCLDIPSGPHWIAIGDAASSIDPLASAGITLALRDGARAADAVARHLDRDATAPAEHARGAPAVRAPPPGARGAVRPDPPLAGLRLLARALGSRRRPRR